MHITLAGHVIDIAMDDEYRINIFKVNSTDILSHSGEYRASSGTNFLPSIASYSREKLANNASMRILKRENYDSKCYIGLIAALTPFVHGKTGIDTLSKTIDQFRIGTSDEMLKNMLTLDASAFWQGRMRGIKTNSYQFRRIQDLIVALLIPQIIDALDESIISFARSVNYIAPLRATVDRYYRVQGLAIDAVDSEGKNLAIFLRSLTESEKNVRGSSTICLAPEYRDEGWNKPALASTK